MSVTGDQSQVHISDRATTSNDRSVADTVGRRSKFPSFAATMLPPTPQKQKQRRRNPFSERRRNNFPDWDTAFEDASPSSPLQLKRDEKDDVDRSVCSQASSTNILNMSIGARAALNEHLRNVEKYGIDGEKQEGSVENDNQYVAADERPLDDHHHDGEDSADPPIDNSLDCHWENLLNSSRVNASSGAESSISFSQAATPPSHILYGENSIEVMTDVSFDFFNSSRVQFLTTPERNKNRQVDMVVTREMNVSVLESSLEEASSFHSDGFTPSPPPPPPSSQFLPMDQQHDSSFQSFRGAVDLSRISSNLGSDHRHTPLPSFDDCHHIGIDDGAFSPIRNTTSPMRNRDFSFSSDLHRETPSFLLDRTPIISSVSPPDSGHDRSSSEDPSHHQRLRMTAATSSPAAAAARAPTTFQNENAVPSQKNSSSTSSSLQSAISSMMTDAYSLVKQVATEVELSMGAIESLPEDFFRAMDLGTPDSSTPSPISPVGSSTSSSQTGSSKKKKARPVRHTPSSSSSKATDPALLTGRRRFRTVVPRRVYLESPSRDMEEEHDSFLAVRSNPESKRANRSLLESFEEAIHETF